MYKKDEFVMKMSSTTTVPCLSLVQQHGELQIMQATPPFYCGSSNLHDPLLLSSSSSSSSSPIHGSKLPCPNYQRIEATSELACHTSSSPNSNNFSLPKCNNQRNNYSSRRQKHFQDSQDRRKIMEHPRRNFQTILRQTPPPAPPALLRNLGRKDNCGLGKVKVILRVSPLSATNDASSSVLSVDSRKKQVTVLDPACCGFITPDERKVGVAAPKMFAFDAVFTQDDSQTELCSGALVDVIQAVLNGTDSCLFSYGNSNLGKTYTMIGTNDSPQTLGIVPCAIAWLYKLINEEKQRSGARFSVRVSAVELAGKDEVLKDLLAEHANGTDNSGISPGIYLREDPIFGMQLQNQSELRAPTVEKAAFYLDAAIENRTGASEASREASHLLFTLHVYQYRVDKSGKGAVAGGRSRLHLLDLSSSENPGRRTSLSLSAISNIILCIFNGQKHIPYKDCKLTNLLREVLGSISCRAAMIAHVSAAAEHYSETLATIQFASRIHRLRRKKLRYCNLSSGESSCEENRFRTAYGAERVRPRISDNEHTSSSEQSCDTVIYLGPNGLPLSDKELTDNEGPPPLLPNAQKCNPSSNSGAFLLNSRNPFANKALAKSIKCPNKIIGKIPLLGRANGMIHDRSNLELQRMLRENSSSVVLEPGKLTQTNPYGQRANGKIHDVSGNVNGAIVGSDEQWIDRPRVKKAWLEAQTLVPKEEKWVDGPQLFYGYMDQYKHDMIQRWVELQSSETLQKTSSRSDEVWIDGDLSVENNLFLQMYEESKRKSMPESNGASRNKSPEEPKRTLEVISEDTESAKDICVSNDREEETDRACFDGKVIDVVPGTVVEDVPTIEANTLSSSCTTTETSLTERADEPATKDSSLQVNEEDILAAHFEQIIDHPLRILSEEDLASSFSDTFSYSVGSDSWCHQHDDAKSRHQAETLLEDDACSSRPLYCDVSVSCRSDYNDSSIYSCSVCSCELDHLVAGNGLGNVKSFAKESRPCFNRTNELMMMTVDARQKLSCRESVCDDELTLLRHPDGASNPNLRDVNEENLDLRAYANFYRNKVRRSPGNGASSSDVEDNRKDEPFQKACYDKNCYVPKTELPKNLSAPLLCNKCDTTVKSADANGAKHKETKQSLATKSLTRASYIPVVFGKSFAHPTPSNVAPAECKSFVSFHEPSRASKIKAPTKIPVLNTKLGSNATKTCKKQCNNGLEEKYCKRQRSSDSTERTETLPAAKVEELELSFSNASEDSLLKKSGKNAEMLQQTSGASSGYESMLRGSEESISSISNAEIVTDSSEDEKHTELASGALLNLDALEIKVYDEDDVERLEKRRMMEQTYALRKNQQQVRELRKRQNELRKELAHAKNNLLIASDCWSFDLHVEESLDVQDPAFLEVLERETQILEKRVTACKSRIMMVTCFDSVISAKE